MSTINVLLLESLGIDPSHPDASVVSAGWSHVVAKLAEIENRAEKMSQLQSHKPKGWRPDLATETALLTDDVSVANSLSESVKSKTGSRLLSPLEATEVRNLSIARLIKRFGDAPTMQTLRDELSAELQRADDHLDRWMSVEAGWVAPEQLDREKRKIIDSSIASQGTLLFGMNAVDHLSLATGAAMGEEMSEFVVKCQDALANLIDIGETYRQTKGGKGDHHAGAEDSAPEVDEGLVNLWEPIRTVLQQINARHLALDLIDRVRSARPEAASMLTDREAGLKQAISGLRESIQGATGIITAISPWLEDITDPKVSFALRHVAGYPNAQTIAVAHQELRKSQYNDENKLSALNGSAISQATLKRFVPVLLRARARGSVDKLLATAEAHSEPGGGLSADSPVYADWVNIDTQLANGLVESCMETLSTDLSGAIEVLEEMGDDVKGKGRGED